jgi:VanZ family protein
MTIQDHTLYCRKCYYLRIVAVLLWTVVLVVASLAPVTNSVFLFKGQDKILHFFAYLLTALLACRTLSSFPFSLRKIVYLSAIYSILIGALLEVLQRTFTASRQGDWLDFAANLAGATCGCVIFCLYRKLSSGTT